MDSGDKYDALLGRSGSVGYSSSSHIQCSIPFDCDCKRTQEADSMRQFDDSILGALSVSITPNPYDFLDLSGGTHWTPVLDYDCTTMTPRLMSEENGLISDTQTASGSPFSPLTAVYDPDMVARNEWAEKGVFRQTKGFYALARHGAGCPRKQAFSVEGRDREHG